MTLKRQLLLVSLLALILPWAGCEFIRETESALRTSQQQLLTGTARATANAISAHADKFPRKIRNRVAAEQLFLHRLTKEPEIDGFFDDWLLDERSLRTIRGADGPIRIAVAVFAQTAFLYVDVKDKSVVYATRPAMLLNDGPEFADRVMLISNNPPDQNDTFVFSAEAPGAIVSYRHNKFGFEAESSIAAQWQDVAGGYRLEASMPVGLLATNIGIVVSNTSGTSYRPTRSSTFSTPSPGPAITASDALATIAEPLAQQGTRMIITDSAGWRIVVAGSLSPTATITPPGTGWSSRIYDLLVEDGKDAMSAEPDPSGREQQPYISAALRGTDMPSWFRSEHSGRAIVAVATPVIDNGNVIGTLVLQQNTDAILSATNETLARLINLTIIATLLVVVALIGYASWLSRRIRHLSLAAEQALDDETLQTALPSALAVDEIGDLSRSFSSVLRQLDDYNKYLRSLASNLSHELRTPLAIVTSSLENLEHEPLNESSLGYTRRALEGADRLRSILNAMSEASRVEELMANVEPEPFDLHAVLRSTIAAYRDVYPQRSFEFATSLQTALAIGSPELLIQMLDKLIDNAVDFSDSGETLKIALELDERTIVLGVTNPGPPLPDNMRPQLFDSMVSLRGGENTRHLGLGLYVAKLIAEGHGGSISADNVADGVRFDVRLPLYIEEH